MAQRHSYMLYLIAACQLKHQEFWCLWTPFKIIDGMNEMKKKGPKNVGTSDLLEYTYTNICYLLLGWFRLWHWALGIGHVNHSRLVATGGITQVNLACHELLTLFGVVIIFWTTFCECLSVDFIIFWLPTERLFTQPLCLWKGNQVTTLLNMHDSNLSFTGQLL